VSLVTLASRPATVSLVTFICMSVCMYVYFSCATNVSSGGGRGGEGGHSPPAALSRGRHFEGRKYGILKIGRLWQIDVCIAERVGS